MASECLPLDQRVEEVLSEARLFAGQGLARTVGIEHLLLALLAREA
jgi:hypothetical protein